MTEHFYPTGSLLYNTVNQKTWIVFYGEYDTELKQWIYLLVLADSKNFLVLGKESVITGSYIAERIKENKIIKK